MNLKKEDFRELCSRLETAEGQYVASSQVRLLVELLKPLRGERQLYVGLNVGYMFAHSQLGICPNTSLVPSPLLADLVRERQPGNPDVRVGQADDLPFSDNEFDLVVLSCVLEFSDNPERAIAEAIRVSRKRVFLGVLNKWAVMAGDVRKVLFPALMVGDARSFSFGRLRGMIQRSLGEVHLTWGSQIFFPCRFFKYTSHWERTLPLLKNPLGAYLGISFPVNYTYRALQDVIRDPLDIKKKGRQPAAGLVREL